MESSFYDQFLNGNWVDPKQLRELPSAPGSKIKPADFSYGKTEPHRLWQVWIETSTPRPTIEMESHRRGRAISTRCLVRLYRSYHPDGLLATCSAVYGWPGIEVSEN